MFGRKYVGKARLHLFIKVADALRCGQIRLGLPRHGFQEEGAPAVLIITEFFKPNGPIFLR